MNDVIFSGYINKPQSPYLITDTGIIASTESIGLAYFDSLGIGVQTGGSNRSNSNSNSNNLVVDVPNPWLNFGRSVTTQLHSLNDFGLIVYCDGNDLATSYGSYELINGNGAIPIYSTYPKMPIAPLGAVAIATNTTGKSIGANYLQSWSYESGAVRAKGTWNDSALADVNMLFTDDGSCFFFFTGNSSAADPVILAVPFGTATMVKIGDLALNKVYCLRSAVTTMVGNVEDAIGLPAVNFTVMAFKRSSGQIVGKTTVKEDGSYEMVCSAIGGDELFVVCLDDDGVAPNFEAQVMDRILV